MIIILTIRSNQQISIILAELIKYTVNPVFKGYLILPQYIPKGPYIYNNAHKWGLKQHRFI